MILDINDIIDELNNSEEISANINIIGNNKEFSPTKTVFIKSETGINTISILLQQNQSENSSSSKMIKGLNSVSALLNSSLDLENSYEVILETLKNNF